MTDQYQILIRKLDQFTRKFYKNQLIKGGIYCLSLVLLFFLLVDTLEYFGHFSSVIRTLLFWGYITLTVLVLAFYVFGPLMKLLKLGKIISHEQAARIIGKHFPNINDKLLNTLQLKKLTEYDPGNLVLIKAGIEQKIREIKPVPFLSAVDFRVNRKYVKYLAIPVAILALILISAPGVITEPSERLMRHNIHFERVLPFTLKVLNDKLEALQHNDFKLEVSAEGEEVPENVYIKTAGNRIRLNRISNVSFNYTFNNVQKDINFELIADKFNSQTYTLKVLPKPVILDFDIDLDYPEYTGKKDENIKNNGDIIIPEGTHVGWKFYTRNTDSVGLEIGGKGLELKHLSPLIFGFDKTFFESSPYLVTTSNKYVENLDSLSYTVSVIPDLYPFIKVDEFRDSIDDRRLFFTGMIKDDYGFRLLTYKGILHKAGTQNEVKIEDTVTIDPSTNPQQFFYNYNLASLQLQPGDEIEYYFEIWDNDAIHGSKFSRSQIMTYRAPTLKEIENEKEKSNRDIKNEMADAMKEVEQLKKEIQDINKKLIDKKKLNWEDKQQVKNLLQKQKDLEEKLEDIKNKNEEKSAKEQQFTKVDDQILEKQKQLEELFNKLIENPEIKELFENLQKLMDELDKDKVNKMLNDMKLSSEDMEKMLDRNLELFKQLEFEQKLQESIQKLKDLAEKQDQLSEKTEDKKQDLDDVSDEQKDINDKFNDLQDDLNKLDSLNKDLETPNQFDKMEDQQQSIDDELQNSMQQLNNNKRKDASKSQKNAGQKMNQMAQNMFNMQQQMINQSMREDMESLRDILENLIQLSFDQEDLIDRVNNTNINDPKYTGLIQDQKNIKDDLKMVEDSLYALSKRQIMMQPFISKEVQNIDMNIEKSMNFLNNRRTNQAASSQQYVMTSVNNLALMLSESLDQMQAMMMQSMNSNSCKNSGMPKPGQGSMSMQSLRKMQEQLNKQLEKMKSGQQMPGKGNPMGKQDKSGQRMSEQLARTTAQQEYIRNELRKKAEQLDKEGQFGSGKNLKKIMQDMDQTETDLVNKRITQETLMRQKQILTRLLESEKAEMEREKEEKRESKEAKNSYSRNPEDILQYKKVQKNEVELLRTVPPSLKPFYKSKVDQYFINFDELLEQ